MRNLFFAILLGCTFLLPLQALAGEFPPRASDALSGSAFGAQVAGLSEHDRYAATREQILAGNVPDFLRKLVPVLLTGTANNVTVFVTPDYLAVGSDDDYLTLPLDLPNATALACALGFALPTTRIVDAIYQAATLRLSPIPLPAGPQMRSMPYILEHSSLINGERGGRPPGDLVAGTKKDLVLTERMLPVPGQEAIYGWHRMDGRPIQPLSLVHGIHYADYSHGIRLVADTVLVDGAPQNYFDVLANPQLATTISQEGAMPDADLLMHRLIKGI